MDISNGLIGMAVGTPGKTMPKWPPFQIAAIVISILFFITVIELIRRNRLKEKYAILWLASAVVLLVFSSSVRLLNKTSKLLGIDYPPSMLFLIAFVFLLFIVFHFSTVISKETERSKTLAQKIGLLENRIKELEKRLEEDHKK
jgi:hypothetical protein